MLKYLCVAVPASLLILGNVAAHAGKPLTTRVPSSA
jgi:hypothetical protein